VGDDIELTHVMMEQLQYFILQPCIARSRVRVDELSLSPLPWPTCQHEMDKPVPELNVKKYKATRTLGLMTKLHFRINRNRN
jgi:hypothetical protein